MICRSVARGAGRREGRGFLEMKADFFEIGKELFNNMVLLLDQTHYMSMNYSIAVGQIAIFCFAQFTRITIN
jgi:hypothetical protein